jgi:hypothetical protein
MSEGGAKPRPEPHLATPLTDVAFMRRKFQKSPFVIAHVLLWLGALVDHAQARPPLLLHIATDGNDSWSGRVEEPNAGGTDGPFATIERARDAIRSLRQLKSVPNGGVVVVIKGGTYEFARPLELRDEDSGTEQSPIGYRARNKEDVRIIGGRVIDDWQPVTDPLVLSRLEGAAIGNVLQASLPAHGVTDFGEMRPAPRWGQSEPGLEVFFQGKPMTLSRWPNQGFVTIDKVLGPTPVDATGDNGCREGIFTYEGDRPSRWLDAKDIMLHGFWARDWADQRLRVESIDADKRIISLEPEPKHEFGFKNGHRYYAYNVLSELDQPGEWFLDRQSGTLYFWPPAPLDREKPIVSVLPTLVSMKDVSHVTFRGITFEGCRGTAVTLVGGTQTRLVGCVIRNTGGWGVDFTGRESGVVGCDLYNLASGGISLAGGDRRTLSSAGLYVDNCHLHRFGRWNPINNPGIRLDGVGNRVTHSLLHDAPHMGVMWSGNDHIFEYNEFHSLVQSANDAGIMYAGFNPTMRGNVIRHNYFHDVYGFEGRGCQGVYLDDEFCSATIYGNVFYRVPRAAFIGGGHDNIIENNIFVDCNPALHVDARMLGWAKAHKPIMRERLEQVPYKDEPWRTRYPELLTYLDGDYAIPRNNLVARNICWGGAWDDVEALARQGVRFVDNLIGEDPRFVDATRCDFTLRQDSPAWKLGFQPVSLENIGPYESEERATWPVHHKVVRPPQPKLDFSTDSLRFLLGKISHQRSTAWTCGLVAMAFWAGLHRISGRSANWFFKAVLSGLRILIGFIALVTFAHLCSPYINLPRRRTLWVFLLLGTIMLEAIVTAARVAWRRLCARRNS